MSLQMPMALVLAATLAGTLSSCDRGAAAPTSPDALAPPTILPPTHLPLVFNQPWTSADSWSYLRRAASKDDDVVNDTAAPFSPPSVLRIVFTPDMGRDSEPSVHWVPLPDVTEIYTVSWIKLSSNWSCSPAGCGKVTFLFTSSSGQVYSGVYHSASSDGPPYRIAVNTEWAPYGQQVWYPNVTTTPIRPGQWHKVEFHHRWETNPGVSGDGLMRWWVDGALNGNYATVHYPAAKLVEFQYAPTLQNPPSAEQYMYIDHTQISFASGTTGQANRGPR
jgi:hypothetical protein